MDQNSNQLAKLAKQKPFNGKKLRLVNPGPAASAVPSTEKKMVVPRAIQSTQVAVDRGHGPLHIQDQETLPASALSGYAGQPLSQMASMPLIHQIQGPSTDSIISAQNEKEKDGRNRSHSPLQALALSKIHLSSSPSLETKAEDAHMNIYDDMLAADEQSFEEMAREFSQHNLTESVKKKFRRQAEVEMAAGASKESTQDSYFELKIARQKVEARAAKQATTAEEDGAEEQAVDEQEEEAETQPQHMTLEELIGFLNDKMKAKKQTGKPAAQVQPPPARDNSLPSLLKPPKPDAQAPGDISSVLCMLGAPGRDEANTATCLNAQHEHRLADWQKPHALGDQVKKGLERRLAEQLKQQLLEGTVPEKTKEARARTPRREDDCASVAAAARQEVSYRAQHAPAKSDPTGGLAHAGHVPHLETDPKKYAINVVEFLDHFEVEDMLTRNCIRATAKKLRGRSFVLKQLTEEQLELYSYRLRRIELQMPERKPERLLNNEQSITKLDLVENWVGMPPQVPLQNFNACYGLVKIKNNIYTICDFVEDNVLLPYHQSDLEERWKVEEQAKDVPQVDSQAVKSKVRAAEARKAVKASQNVHELIKEMKMGNIRGTDKIPEAYVWALLEYIVQTSRAFAHAHHHDVVHGKYGLAKVLMQRRGGNNGAGTQSGNSDPCFTFGDGNDYHFIIINFEPWTVEQLMKQFESGESPFSAALGTEKLKLERSYYLRVAKLLDLQAYGASIVDMLVGKYLPGASNRIEGKQPEQLGVAAKQPGAPAKEQPSRESHSSKAATDAKRLTSAMCFDQIPLKWSSLSQIGALLEVLHLCVGPHDANNNISEVDTTAIFERIHGIASAQLGLLLHKHLGPEKLAALSLKPMASGHGHGHGHGHEEHEHQMLTARPSGHSNLVKQQQLNLALSGDKLRRLRSAQLNNKASMLIFSVSAFTPATKKMESIRVIDACLQEALQLWPRNQTARLNKVLLDWCRGFIGDDAVEAFVQRELYELDEEAAILFFMLVKQHIRGAQVAKNEKKRFLRRVLRNQDKISNLARYMLDDQLFLEAREQVKATLKEAGDGDEDQYDYEDDDDEDEQTPAQPGDGKGGAGAFDAATAKSPPRPLITNHRVDIDNTSFKAKKFFFSNNDRYFGVIGATELIAFDSLTGRQLYRRSFPKSEWRPPVPQLGPGADGPSQRPSTAATRQPPKKVRICSRSQYDHSADQSRCARNEQEHVPSFNEEENTTYNEESASSVSALNVTHVSNYEQSRAQLMPQASSKGRLAEKMHPDAGAAWQTRGRQGIYGQKQIGEEQGVIGEPPMRPMNTVESGATQFASRMLASQASLLKSQPQLLDQHHYYSTQGTSGLGYQSTFYNASKMHGVAAFPEESGSLADSSIQRTLPHIGALNERSAENLMNIEAFPREQTRQSQLRHMQDLEGSSQQSEDQLDLPSRQAVLQGYLESTGASGANQRIYSAGPAHLLGNSHFPPEYLEQAKKEKEHYLRLHECAWEADIGNNGKLIALFDRAQQVRNRLYKYEVNRAELVFVYDLSVRNPGNQTAGVTCIDLDHLLDQQEVLSFGFDDHNTSPSAICVQAKDLYLYLVDYTSNVVLRRVGLGPHSLNRRSAFYNSSMRKSSLAFSEALKQFVEEQESLGNMVLLPKIEDKILGVQIGQTNVVRIYSVQPLEVVRQLVLDVGELTLRRDPEQDGASDAAIEEESQPSGSQPSQSSNGAPSTKQYDKGNDRGAARQTLGKGTRTGKEEHQRNDSKNTNSSQRGQQEKRKKVEIREEGEQIADGAGGAQAEKAKNEARAGFLQVYPLTGKYHSIDQYVQRRRGMVMRGAAAPAKGRDNEPAQRRPAGESQEADHDEAPRRTKKKTKSAQMVDISPTSRYIACVVDGKISLKVLNTIARWDPLADNNDELEKMYAFMPIYQDLDYQQLNLPKHQEADLEGSSHVSSSCCNHTSMSGSQASDVESQSARNSDVTSQLSRHQPGPTKQQQQLSLPQIAKDPVPHGGQIPQDLVQAGIDLKLHPSTVDRCCQLFVALNKRSGAHTASSYLPIKFEKLQELHSFISLIASRPALLLECNLRPKLKAEKISTCFQMLRRFSNLDEAQIKLAGYRGINHFTTFNDFKFNRSFEQVHALTCNSMAGCTYLAALVGRMLQVYDFATNALLFSMKIPNASQYCCPASLSGYPLPFCFLDNDQLLMYQEGESSLVFISIGTQMEVFAQQAQKQVNQDVTIKIERPLSEYLEFANEFKIADEDRESQGCCGQASEEPDHAHAHSQQTTKKYLNLGWKIDSVFVSDSTARYAYVAVLGKMRIAVFYMQEDLSATADCTVILDKDYRFDKELRGMGQITAVGFENTKCGEFLTCSQIGWLCLWSLEREREHNGGKQMIAKVKLNIEPKIQICSLIRYLEVSHLIFAYFPRSHTLQRIDLEACGACSEASSRPSKSVHESKPSKSSTDKAKTNQNNQNKAPSQSPRKYQPLAIRHQDAVLVEQLNGQLGLVKQMQEDRTQSYMFILTSLHYVLVYELEAGVLVQKLGPYQAAQMHVDEPCSQLTVLDPLQQQASFSFMDWSYELQRDPGHFGPLSFPPAGKRRTTTPAIAPGADDDKNQEIGEAAPEKSKACVIF